MSASNQKSPAQDAESLVARGTVRRLDSRQLFYVPAQRSQVGGAKRPSCDDRGRCPWRDGTVGPLGYDSPPFAVQPVALAGSTVPPIERI